MDWQYLRYIQTIPRVKIIKRLDNIDAVLVKIDNGRGTLKSQLCYKSDYHDDCMDFYKLTLNNKTILQNYSAVCPTCAGLLAAGYGIENVFSPELVDVGQKANNDFENIAKSAANLSPLLSLLESGIYMIADLPHIPTDGSGRFFWNVPNEKTYYSAHCESYYQKDSCSTLSSYPKYLYPTQGTKRYNHERVMYYVKRMEFSKNPPRPIVYNLGTFMSAVLDGHHKTCAAALLGREINCITIMPFYGYQVNNSTNEVYTLFADWNSDKFKINIKDCPELEEAYSKRKKQSNDKDKKSDCFYSDNKPFESHIFTPILEQDYDEFTKKYLNVEDMALRSYLGIGSITKEYIDRCFEKSNRLALLTIIRSEAVLKNPLAKYAGIRVLKNELNNFHNDYITDNELLFEAVSGLMYFKDDEIEQLMIKLLTEDKLSEKVADLIKDYWNN